MARKEIAVKKYIVTLSDEEREQLTTLIHSGKHPAHKLLKARILLKADASEGGGLERQPDRGGARDQCRHGRQDAPVAGRRRV